MSRVPRYVGIVVILGVVLVVLSCPHRVVITSPLRRIFRLYVWIKPNLRWKNAKTKVDLHSKGEFKVQLKQLKKLI